MRRLSHLSVLLAVSFLSVLAGGCGGKSAEEVGQDRRAQVDLLVSNVEAAGYSRIAACEKAIKPVLRIAQDLHARLRVGIFFSDYMTRVGDLAVSYSKRPPIHDLQCDAVRRLVGSARDRYKYAGSSWSHGYDETERQRQWALAAAYIKEANRAMSWLDKNGWSIAVPPGSAAVASSIYGAAIAAFCTPATATTSEGCEELQSVLEGGVSAEEADALADAVKALNDSQKS